MAVFQTARLGSIPGYRNALERLIILIMSRARRKKLICPNCKKEYFPWGNEAKFCSVKCMTEIDYRRRLELVNQSKNWKDGWINVALIKREVIKKRGWCCQICENTMWNGGAIPLVLDHIDGNSDNWQDSNLRLVCGNCDMLLPTYKGKNKGNGRFYRKQRYRNGKSF